MSVTSAVMPAGHVAAEGGPPVAAAELEFRYRGGGGVGPVALRIDAGEVAAVMGPNGSGKTTLLLLLAGLLGPQRGAVRWWGRPDSGAARRRLGVALDDSVEDSALSGRQATTFWCRQWVSDPTEARRLADAALHDLGLTSVADRAVGGYSFGMRRRLGLAQALAHRPPLLLLDEPTAGLDPDGVGDLVGLLRHRAAGGDAILVASNDASFVAAAADRVLLLDGGRLVHAGTPAELMAGVDSARWADVESDDPAALVSRLRQVVGADRCERIPGGARIRLGREPSLAQVVLAADAVDGGLRALHVHETDLADCFRQLTGHPLVDEAAQA
ncbi:MAG: ATP-binding cassette domain-containing protein [Candidatus Dormibacteria bacterium]